MQIKKVIFWQKLSFFAQKIRKMIKKSRKKSKNDHF